MQEKIGLNLLLHCYTRAQVPTPSEEILLAQQVRSWLDWPEGEPVPSNIKRAGVRAKKRLLEGNLRLAIHVAGKHKKLMGLSEDDYQDCIQNACFGLNRAIEKFDPKRGYKFSTYAYWWIKQAIQRNDAARKAIRIPDQARKEFKNLGKAISELRERGITPTAELLSEMTGLSTKQVAERAEIGKIITVNSLDQLAIDDGTPLVELITDNQGDMHEALELEMRAEWLEGALFSLGERERQVVQQKLEGASHRSIGRSLDVSSTRVGQLWGDAKRKLGQELEQQGALAA